MTDTFFDLQRFAVLVGGQSSFSWKDGETFGPVGTSAAIGTEGTPAYLASGGASQAGTGSEIYLSGEKSYSFSLDGKDDWSLKLGSDGIAQVTNGASGLALADLEDTAAVLNVNGTFEETFNGNAAYIKTASDTKVTLNSVISLLSEKFAKNTSDVDVVVGGGIVAEFAKGASNIGVGLAEDNIVDGFAFDKAATVAGTENGEISIFSENNTVTLPDGDTWKVKKTSGDFAQTEIYYNIANAAVDSVIGIKGATLTGDVDAPVLVGSSVAESTVWNEISGGVSTIEFDSLGSAKVENDGAVTVNGTAGAEVTIENLDTAGATVNSIKVAAADETLEDVAFTLETVEGGGLSVITLKKPGAVTVNKDQEFTVEIGKSSYDVETDADSITFDASASRITIDAVAEKTYDVDGAASFVFEDGAKVATFNTAKVSVSSNEGVVVQADDKDDEDGITRITGLQAGEKVSVSGDDDGFTATFAEIEDDDEYVFQVNNASIRAGGISGQTVSVSVSGDGKDVLITGMASTDQVSVAGASGITYHFKDADRDNQVTPGTSESIYVTLDGSGGIGDAMDDANYKKLKENDAGKWNNVATIGNRDEDAPPVDTVPTNLSTVYEQFYNLGTSDAGQASVAVFANEDATVASTVANPSGITFSGNASVLAESAHITMRAGSAVGAAPINIQKNESDAAVDVTINLQNATVPSTVALGTIQDTVNGDVTASHKIYLSNSGVGYANIGEYATGQNKIFAGTAGSQIRHDGVRATITGNKGNDTIWAGEHDIVTGGAGSDQFYDSDDYTILDYNASEGDALIGTRLHSVSEITKDNVTADYDAGNEVSFGTSKNSFTIGKDQNASLNLKVAVMDTDARIVDSRNVAIAGKNGGALDASGLDGAALILADADRNGDSGDNITGTAYGDTIYVGPNDTVNGGAGNDYITISGLSVGDGNAGALVYLSAGKDTIEGWTFGFDRNSGSTELRVDGDYRGSFENDRLLVTGSNGSILFDDTKQTALHGEYNVIVNGTNWMAIRTNDGNNSNPDSYGDVESNAEIADAYIAERAGILSFTSGVTENLGMIDLAGTQYQNITNLTLNNNSKASVLGGSERETVALGGDASVGANKAVSLGAGNDVIISGGDGTVSAGHTFFFGANDGRDTLRGFSHYLGIDADPDKQYADTLVLGQYNGIYTGTGEDGGTRIEFVTGDEGHVFLYETEGISVDNMYQIKVGDFDTKLAKIGNSNSSNVFTFSDKVDYYVGSSADNAADTLKVGNEIANANIWLDGTSGTYDTNADEQYYRGIAFVDAGAETDTTVALAGNGSNNTLIGGGAGTYNSLWGGAGNNLLIGSTAGQDTFFYVRSAGAYLQGVDETVTGGSDTVQNYDLDNGDIVWLGDTTVDDILNTDVQDNSVTVNFKNGGSLTVEGSDDVRFVINSGTESWVTDKDSSDNKFVQES